MRAVHIDQIRDGLMSNPTSILLYFMVYDSESGPKHACILVLRQPESTRPTGGGGFWPGRNALLSVSNTFKGFEIVNPLSTLSTFPLGPDSRPKNNGFVFSLERVNSAYTNVARVFPSAGWWCGGLVLVF